MQTIELYRSVLSQKLASADRSLIVKTHEVLDAANLNDEPAPEKRKLMPDRDNLHAWRAFCQLATLLFALAGLPLASAREPFASELDGFQLLVPAGLEHERRSAGDFEGSHIFRRADGSMLTVVRMAFPDKLSDDLATGHRQLDQHAEELAKALRGENIRISHSAFAGGRGRDVYVDVPTKGFKAQLSLIAFENQLYVVTAYGNPDFVESDDVLDAFESFKIAKERFDPEQVVPIVDAVAGIRFRVIPSVRATKGLEQRKGLSEQRLLLARADKGLYFIYTADTGSGEEDAQQRGQLAITETLEKLLQTKLSAIPHEKVGGQMVGKAAERIEYRDRKSGIGISVQSISLGSDFYSLAVAGMIDFCESKPVSEFFQSLELNR